MRARPPRQGPASAGVSGASHRLQRPDPRAGGVFERGDGWLIVADGRVLHASAGAERLLGGRRNEWLGVEITRLFPDETWDKVASVADPGSGSDCERTMRLVGLYREARMIRVRVSPAPFVSSGARILELIDESRQRSAEKFVEAIADATKGCVGEEYCRALASTIGPLLGCRRFVVARLLDAENLRCRSIVVWTDGALSDGREFLADEHTASGRALREGMFETWGDLLQRFPEWTGRLGGLGVDSVVSVALQTAGGATTGFISAFFDPSVAQCPDVARWLRLYGARVAAELERIQAEQARRELAELLHEAQKMEAVGRLAGGIAHDFNNALTIILGNLQLAGLEAGEDKVLQSVLEEALVGAQRAREIAAQLLTFSRRRPRQLVIAPLAPLVEEAVRLMRVVCPANITMAASVQGIVPDVRCDPTQIHQVVMNLCANAVHAMRRGGGTLNIRLSAGAVPPALHARMTGASTGHAVLLEVQDTGHGMDEATRSRIFEPFFTTKPVGEGTGLGLAVVHGIIESLGGVIQVFSEPGAGAEFRIYLPAAEGERAVATTALQPCLRGAGQRVLVVDDNVPVGRAMGRILSRSGYQPTVVASVWEAMDRLRDASEPWDVMITDFAMPVLNGVELARHAQSTGRAVPVVLISGNTSAIDDGLTRDAGIVAVLEKPYTRAELIATVQTALAAKATPGGISS